MQALMIGEVARRAGIRPSAIRYYESVGLLPAPERASGQRQYGEDVLQRLAVIQAARQAGFTVAEIRTLLHSFPVETPPSARWQALAHRKLDEVKALIRRAEGMKRILEQGLVCECTTLVDCAALISDKAGVCLAQGQ